MALKKTFRDRFNRVLDRADVPQDRRERCKAVSRLFNITGPIAMTLVDGSALPKPEVLKSISEEFEVTEKWLLGE